jgi:hypothetical protein
MKKYILNKEVRLKHDEAYNKYYAFCIYTGDHFTLNKTGFSILNTLDEGKSLIDIVAMLTKETNIDKETIETDVIHFLELSQKNGIIALIM